MPDFPSDIEKYLTQKLSDLKKVIDKNRKTKDELNYKAVEICMREIFVKSFIKLFGDYSKYCAVIDDVPVFNTESFVLNRPTKNADFYTELTETQLFNLFLQSDVKECFPFFFKLNERPSLLNRSNSLCKRSVSVSLPEEREHDYRYLVLNSYLKVKDNNLNNLGQTAITEITDLTSGLSLVEKIRTFNESQIFKMPPYFSSANLDYFAEEDCLILPEAKRVFDSIFLVDFSDLPSKVRRGIFLNDIQKKTSVVNIQRNISNSIMSKVANYTQKAEQNKKNKFFPKRDKSENLYFYIYLEHNPKKRNLKLLLMII
jgi:hypothetical protein